MAEHTQKNIEKLADAVIDNMTIKDMEQTLYDIYVENFDENQDAFDTAWEAHFGT